MSFEKVYIIIINWNGWGDTIECLESVFRLNYLNYTVIVCDNDSSDNSVEHIKAWADGHLNLWTRADNPLRPMTFPSIIKPIPFIISDNSTDDLSCKCEVPLVIIRNSRNIGFAAANNVGLRYALNNMDLGYAWILNNDTVVLPDSLQHLIESMREDCTVGICGSTLLYYDKPNLIQSQGGSGYNKWLGTANAIGVNKSIDQMLGATEVARQIDYVAGASMLISQKFILNIGLMSEDYFLYNEEIDWAVRGNKSYKLGYAEKSIVYHKEGASIGSSIESKSRSVISEYFMIRNRFKFTSKFFPYALPFVFAGFVITLINRVRRREWNKIIPIMSAALFFKKQRTRYS